MTWEPVGHDWWQWLTVGFLLGWMFRIKVWQRLLSWWFPELYAPDAEIHRTYTQKVVVCPDCEVGEPHVCPLLEASKRGIAHD